ncbi:hypothetical protein [Cyanobium gracile]|uniref:Alkaline proteinase inhibitor/ Outer membrane lipoprotein Omp19 domain-containing protein n=1 Tax=Cyanobium gracile UHCC 0281 TaxID=3110309 RepID=A0ABU5SSS7_9CYAN|nr:hypothetical protein [Cyanobium gracile]MEA5441594.1 hypothetical protein [Cyanobium gracile UHCC 0281]
MRKRVLTVAVALATASTPSWAVPAPSACEAALGTWDYVAPSKPGRAVVTKLADGRHHLVWIASEAGATAAGAWEATCEGSRRTWRILFPSDPGTVGLKVLEEFEVSGDAIRFWLLGPDGKRGPMGGARRLP